MDSTAFSLCMDNRMPILVFDLQQEQSFAKRFAVNRLERLFARLPILHLYNTKPYNIMETESYF